MGKRECNKIERKECEKRRWRGNGGATASTITRGPWKISPTFINDRTTTANTLCFSGPLLCTPSSFSWGRLPYISKLIAAPSPRTNSNLTQVIVKKKLRALSPPRGTVENAWEPFWLIEWLWVITDLMGGNQGCQTSCNIQELPTRYRIGPRVTR